MSLLRIPMAAATSFAVSHKGAHDGCKACNAHFETALKARLTEGRRDESGQECVRLPFSSMVRDTQDVAYKGEQDGNRRQNGAGECLRLTTLRI